MEVQEWGYGGGNVLGGKIMKGASVLKEGEEGLVVGLVGS